MSKQHQIFVVWGESIDRDSRPSCYEFQTEAEREAFLLGIAEASGWMDAAAFKTKEEAYAYIEEEVG